MADQDTLLPVPTDPPIMFDGEPITASRMVEIFERNWERAKPSRDAIKRTRDLRRKTLRTVLAKTWVDKNPEAAKNAMSLLSERTTLEYDIKARAGAVEPAYVCEPSPPGRETDYQNAEAKEHYLNEWRLSMFGVPFQTFLGKGVEDGEYGRVRLPADLAPDGRPDFFDRLTDEAYAALGESERTAYRRDGADRHKRYTRMDERGKPAPSPTWDRDKAGRTRSAVMRRGETFSRDQDTSSEAHDVAVQRYLLQRPASVGRVIPALDVAPIWAEGEGRERFKLIGLIERKLVSREEAIAAHHGWVGMGDRALVPAGEDTRSVTGQQGQWYRYTLYLTNRDANGIERPLLLYCIGGKGTYDTRGGYGSGREGDPNSVTVIDLYHEYGLEGPLWSYHGGLTSDDDNPAYRWRPYLDAFVDLILGIEGIQTSIRATTHLNAFTGYLEQPDEKLLELDPEAMVETGPAGKRLRRPEIPPAGEIRRRLGPIEPFNQATIGADAWRLEASDRLALAAATANDQANPAPGSSGHAIVVGETLAKVGKRQIREGARDAVVADGIAHLKILDAIAWKHQIRWPLQAIEKPASGTIQKKKERPRYTFLEFDPAWVEGGAFGLKAAYPEEENIARIDQEFTLWRAGAGSFSDLQTARGKSDARAEWIEILKDKIRQDPRYLERIMLGVAYGTGDREMIALMKQLQAQGEMTQPLPGVPGAANGLPTAALRRPGEQTNQGGTTGGAPTAASVRGGIISGEKATASRTADATAQMQIEAS